MTTLSDCLSAPTGYARMRLRPGDHDGPIHERTATVGEIRRGHAGVLTEFLVHPGRWLVWITVDPAAQRTRTMRRMPHLWFVLLEDRETIIAECSSNQVLDEDAQLDAAQEDRLLELGWREPESPWTSSFHLQRTGRDGIAIVAELAAATLHQVLGLEPSDEVRLGFQRRFLDGEPAP